MLRENLEEEAVIMKDVPGWKVKKHSGCYMLLCVMFKVYSKCSSVLDAMLQSSHSRSQLSATMYTGQFYI